MKTDINNEEELWEVTHNLDIVLQKQQKVNSPKSFKCLQSLNP